MAQIEGGVIQPPGFRGAAFTTAADGDMRAGDRARMSDALGISAEWATVSQIHGSELRVVVGPGNAGRADAIGTGVAGLPLAVLTADCAGVVLESSTAVAVVHAGWRGVAAGAVSSTVDWMAGIGGVERGAIGPTIGPCCFEVGPEVAAEFAGYETTTSWGTTSVDLDAAIRAQMPEIEVWSAEACTQCGDGWFSHRRDATPARLATIGWLP